MIQQPEDPDYTLIRSFIDYRDKRSFNRLILNYQNDVFNFCYRFLGDAEDAADCSQEVFIRIYRHLPKFGFRSKFSTWLYRVTINACRDMSRTRTHRINQVVTESSAGYDGIPTPEMMDSGSSLSPEKEAIRKEIREVFQAALCRIRENYRTVIILRDVEGRSYEEIATLTGMKLGTVRSTLARARLEMAGYLKEYRYEL